MKLNRRLIVIGSALACGAALSPRALASGIILYEYGTPDVGLASAGFASRASAAATLYKNPAGMSQLSGSQFQGGAQVLFGKVSFTPNDQTSASLGSNAGGNGLPVLPAASLFYTHQINDQWSVGLGTLSYFGLASKYDDNWVGRYYVQKSALIGMSVLPTVSYKVNEWLAVGAGLNAMYGFLDSQMAVNNGPGWSDGQLTLKDHNWGFGANAGVLVKLSDQTRVGASYLSRVKLDFAVTPERSGPFRPALAALLDRVGQVALGVTVPQQVMAGVYHDLNSQWSLMLDAGWQNWAAFGEPTIAVTDANATSITLNSDFQNTWHLAGGAEFRLNPAWTFTGGVGYDSSMMTDANRTVTLPSGSTWRFGAGARWQVSKRVNLGAAYELLWNGDLSVDQERGPLAGRVAGTYQDSYIMVVALNLVWNL